MLVAQPLAAQPEERGDERGFESRVEAETEELDCEPEPELGEEQRLARASEHFDRGRELYEQGSYQQSIREFAAAYCHAPDPAPLKNIAQAYERLIQYEKAVAYLKRYILELPPERKQERDRTGFRLKVLERQPASIRVATLPPGAEVVLETEAGPVAKRRANEAPIMVQRGTYTMKIREDGYQPVELDITAQIGQPYSYYFRLEKLKGSLRVSTQPGDARIFVDKRLVGVGSYTSTVPVGSYQLTVEQGDRPTVDRTVEVSAERATNVNVAMDPPPKSGRVELLLASTATGGALGGTALGSVFDSDGGAIVGIGAGLGIGFVGGFFGIPDDIPVRRSSLIIGSSLWMATEGVLFTALLSCDRGKGDMGEATESCADLDTFVAAGSITGVAGLVGSALWGDRLELSAGDVSLVNSGATWGLAAGGLLWSTFDEDPEARDPLLLAGLNLGLLASGIIAAQVEVSRSRIALIDLSGLGGLLVGVAAARLAEETGAGIDRADHFALVGMSAGLVAGSFLTRGVGEDDPSSSSLRPATQSITDAAGNSNLGFGAALEF